MEELGTGESITVLLTSQEVQTHLQKLETLLLTESQKAKAKQQEEQAQKRVKELKKIAKELGQEAVKLAKYEQQAVVLAGRNSYSKTDTDATYLQMKRDESLPAYNIQQSTCSQYIVNYTISSNASDSPTFPAHVEKQAERLEGIKSLKGINYIADAGYGSEENYAFCEQKAIEAYIKYPLWYQEISGELAKRKFRVENWTYNPTNDTFTCPNNRILSFKAEQVQLSANQYERTIKLYQSENCQDCPFAEECKKTNNPRSVSFSPQGEAYKEKAKALLDTDIGKEKRKERSVEVETPFGDIKLNMQYERFILRGKQKVYIEYGLLAMAHNLRKVYCHESGVWKDYYTQRAAKKQKKT